MNKHHFCDEKIAKYYIIDMQFGYFPDGFASKGVLSKDSTVWLDRARPANTCIPPTFLGNVPTQPCGVPTPKTHLQVQKIINGIIMKYDLAN
jgi:hypothetical protein